MLRNICNFRPTPRERNGPWSLQPFYRKIQIDGLSIFYEEAGAERRANAFAVARGFRSLTRMFEPVLSAFLSLLLSPGSAPTSRAFGHSDSPVPKKCAYNIRSHSRKIMNHSPKRWDSPRYTLYMAGLRGPVGFRSCLGPSDPDRVSHRPGRLRTTKACGRMEDRRAFGHRAANESALLRTNLVFA